MAKTYKSQAAVSLTVSSQAVINQLVTGQILANLPSAAGLAQAFTQQIGTHALSKALDADNPDQFFEARFDDRKGLLTLVASGATPAGARERADRLLRAAQEYLRARIAAAATENLKSALEQATLDLRTAESSLRDVQALLSLKGRPAAPVSPTVSAALEAQKVDPQLARSPNAAYAYLTIQEATLQAQLAQSRARVQSLEGVMKDSDALVRLVGQSLQVQVLAPPAEPLRQSAPRPVFSAGLAGALGLFVGVAGVLFREAIRPPE
jgi:LPS O-antigen subunit length determinant protein (WzzB/FepE family)